MLNASYNLGLRGVKAYIPEYPVGTADEVADMAYSVITASDYLTGQIITFDGGWI